MSERSGSEKRQKTALVGVRFSPEDRERIDLDAHQHGMTTPEWLRYLALVVRNWEPVATDGSSPPTTPEVVDEPWDEITAKHWKEIKGGLITIKEAYEKG